RPLSLTFQTGDAKYFAGVCGEADVVEKLAGVQPIDLQHRARVSGQPGSLGKRLLNLATQHEPDELVITYVCCRECPDIRPVAEHVNAVGYFAYLCHAASNEYDGFAFVARLADQSDEPMNLVGPQR